jgi:hypothetical protein
VQKEIKMFGIGKTMKMLIRVNTEKVKLVTQVLRGELSTGGVKTEWVFPGLSVLRKNNKMEVLYQEK